MKEIILNVLKKMRTDYGNNENIIFAQDSDLQVVANEIEKAINYSQCCKSDSELLTSFAEYLKERDILTTKKENIPVRVDLFLKRG